MTSCGQQIPVHGVEHTKERPRLEGKGARHSDHPRYGPVSEDKKGTQRVGGFTNVMHLTHALQPDSDPIETTFELNDTLYAKANVPPTNEVYLWLGANVMLAYPIDEAETLLEGKLKSAQETLVHCEEDLDFLREQITVGTTPCSLIRILTRAY